MNKTPTQKNFDGLISEEVVTVELSKPLQALSNSDVADVQTIAASNLAIMEQYYNEVLNQAKKSFFWAIVAAALGLMFFIAAISFIILQSQDASIISVICGALIEVVSAINFYLYKNTSSQLSDFHNRLDTTQRFLIANSICEGLDNENKQKARARLIRDITGNSVPVLLKTSAREVTDERRNNNN